MAYMIQNIATLVAFGVNEDSLLEVLATAEDVKENRSDWNAFISSLEKRSLKNARFSFLTKALTGEYLADHYSQALWQCCSAHFSRNVFTNVPHVNRPGFRGDLILREDRRWVMEANFLRK
jgi:transposase-like protein